MNTTFPFEINGVEVPVEVEFDYSPYRPGRYTGPPEDCYEEEREDIEITSIEASAYAFGHDYTIDLAAILEDKDALKRMTEAISAKLKQEREDAEADRGDYLYEQRQDRRTFNEC